MSGDLAVSWKQDPNRVRSYLSGRHLRVQQGQDALSFATVSGVLSTKTPLIRYADTHLPEFGVITTKSFQVTENPGNREPIICEMSPGSFGNSVGLRNPGMEFALEELKQLRLNYQMRALLNVSVSASTVEDFIILVKAFAPVADIIELNFSCPHAAAGYGASIGCSEELSGLYMREIRKAFPDCPALIFPKLTPNVPDIATIAREVVECGADGIVAINTVGPEVHREPISGKPILQNALGGKGGKSGQWIRDEALSCVRAIRKAIGPDVPLIGMGGVTTGKDCVAMILSGADVVGIGSAFGKVKQQHWTDFSAALHRDARAVLAKDAERREADQFYDHARSMEYQKFTITKRITHGENTVIITLDGSWKYEAGQFVFLWLPQIGEKPFSIAEADPLTFVIKRRGAFTDALFALREGDELYLRGLYGAPVTLAPTKHAILVGGGTGVAVFPALARKLAQQGTSLDIFIGTSETSDTEEPGLLEETLSQYGTVTIVSDDGKPGRVLDTLQLALHETDSNLAGYIVGPTIFMRKTAQIMLAANIPPKQIQLSLELSTMCGIGMCGECLCGDRLTCAWGTFMDYEYLAKEAPQLL
jgi:dihydroorotate dehydrogenase (NAD+) catalytic subunit